MQTLDHGWLPAGVREKCTEPRSYPVETSDGAMLRRNRRFLRENELNDKSVEVDAEQNIINDWNTDTIDGNNNSNGESNDSVYRTRSGRPSVKPQRLVENNELSLNYLHRCLEM